MVESSDNDPVAMMDGGSFSFEHRVSPLSATFRTGSTLVDELSASQHLPKARVIIVGDSGTGKTSLVKQLATGVFDPMCSPTIGIDYHLQVFAADELEGLRLAESPLALDIWDTAGQERFRALSSSYFRNVSGVLLVFDLSNERTFRNLDAWLKYIHEHTTEGTFMLLLVGNKSDLQRKVSQQEIDQFCFDKNITYLETSSTDHTKTRHMFQQLGEGIIDKGHFKGVEGGLMPKETLPRDTQHKSCCS